MAERRPIEKTLFAHGARLERHGAIVFCNARNFWVLRTRFGIAYGEGDQMHYYFNRIAPPLAILGGVNWALLGAANVDLVAKVFGSGTTLTHSVYVLTGLATLYCLGRASTFRSEPVPTV